MTIKELHEALDKAVEDGNGGVEIVGGMDGGMRWFPIKYVEVYDEPAYIVIGPQNKDSE